MALCLSASAQRYDGIVTKTVALVGNEVIVTPTLKNLGTAGISSIDFTCDLNGETKEGHADLETPIENMFQTQGTVTLNLGTLAKAYLLKHGNSAVEHIVLSAI